MSNNRDLLKEAIADAKSVKETAIANAKAALEEAFTPHLKSMLAAKLEEMDKDEDIDEGYDKYEEDDVKTEEVSAELDEAKKEDKEEVKEAEEVEEAKKEEIEEEIDLDELLAELEEGEEKDEVKESEEIEESEEVTEEEEVEAEEGEDEEAEGEMEEEEVDLEDMTEDDLKSFIEDVIKDMVDAGELEAGEEMEDEMEADADMEGDMEIEVEDEVEPMMEEKEELEEDDAVSKKLKDGASLDSAPRKVGQSTVQEDEVKNALAEVEELKKELNEVNLLNAKLLYTNKIFKAKNLSEDKKVKVLKAFDKAETVKEAKVIFETLNEGILDYSQISALTRSRERSDENLRNQSMSAYLETVDELAQLTGKQRDAVSDSIVAESRKGQTIIRAGQLGDRGDEYAQFVGLMNTEFKGPLGDLSSDILTAGFGLTDETRRMQGLFAPFANALEKLRIAYEDPTSTDAQIKALEDNVRAQAAGTRDSSVMQLGVYSTLNSVSGTIAETAGSIGTLGARIDEYRDMIRSQTGEELSSAQAYDAIQQQIRDRQQKALVLAPEGSVERARQDFITRTIELEKASTAIRIAATDAAYDKLSKVMGDLTGLFGDMLSGLGTLTADTITMFDYKLNGLLDFTSVEFANSIIDAQNTAESLGDNAATTLLTELQSKLLAIEAADANGNNNARQAAESEIRSIIQEINNLKANDMVINARNVVVNDNAPPPSLIPQPPGQMFGSMKTLGRLFNNYGQETMQPLHGLEAVTTPAQMADIVMNAAMGGRSALAQDMVSEITSRGFDSTANNSTARIDSMLNTVSSRLRDVVTTVAQDNNTSPDTVINEFMNQLPKTLKTALEEAMGSSLRPSLEQLVNIGTQHAETSNKIRKGFSGITNDYMRSI